MDIEPGVDPEIIADITDLSPIPSGSVDGVWCSHCMEHLYRHQVPRALSEIRRILTPGGVACIIVPDLQTVAAAVVSDKMHEPLYESPAGPITPHDVFFGFGKDIANGYTFMAHRCGFTPTLLVECLQEATFTEFALLRRSNFELAAIAAKTKWSSDEERDALIAQLRG